MKALATRAIKTLGKLPRLDRLLWHGGQYLDELESVYLSPAWQASRINGHFTSTHGEKLALVDGLRDQIKPNWRAMLEPGVASQRPPAEMIRGPVVVSRCVSTRSTD